MVGMWDGIDIYSSEGSGVALEAALRSFLLNWGSSKTAAAAFVGTPFVGLDSLVNWRIGPGIPGSRDKDVSVPTRLSFLGGETPIDPPKTALSVAVLERLEKVIGLPDPVGLGKGRTRRFACESESTAPRKVVCRLRISTLFLGAGRDDCDEDTMGLKTIQTMTNQSLDNTVIKQTTKPSVWA